MKCLIKIHHRPLIYSFFALASLLFLSAVGFVSDSYAISGICSVSGSFTSSNNISVNTSISCDNNLDTDYYYIKPVSFSYTLNSNSWATSGSTQQIGLELRFNTNTFPRFFSYLYDFGFQYQNSISYPYTLDVSSLENTAWFPSFYSVYSNGAFSSVYQFTSTYFRVAQISDRSADASFVINFIYNTDLDSGSCTCPEPEPCPPIPENPYDDKLDEIKKAIYCASAVMIMIYFFFIVYKIIVKDGGRR